MLIDIHTHAARHRSLVPKSVGFRPLAGELVGMLDAHSIDMAIVLSVVSPERRTFYNTPEDILAVCHEYPDRLVPFCCVDPRWVSNTPESDFRHVFEAYIAAGFKGVGEYIANLPFDDPHNMNVFRQVEEAGLPLTFHIGPTRRGCYGCFDELGLPRLEKVLKAFPKLKLLGHSQPFWSNISRTVTEETWGGYPEGPVEPGRLVDLFREYPNLYGDLSAGSGLNAIRRDPEFGYGFMEEFQDRLLFGTDICYLGQELPIVEYFGKLDAEGLIPKDALEKISWRNAAGLLKLDVKPRAPGEECVTG